MTLSNIWAQVPADYFSTGVKTNLLQRSWHTGKFKAVIKAIKKKEIKYLIDVGSADGSFVNRLTKKLSCSNVAAIDPYWSPLSYGKKNYPQTHFIQADSHHLPLIKNSADVIIILETLEHLLDPYTAILELKRVLKKNGQIIVEMDNGSSLFQVVWFLWKRFGKGKVWQGAHLSNFNTKSLEQLFRRAKLKINHKQTFNLKMGVCYRLTKS